MELRFAKLGMFQEQDFFFFFRKTVQHVGTTILPDSLNTKFFGRNGMVEHSKRAKHDQPCLFYFAIPKSYSDNPNSFHHVCVYCLYFGVLGMYGFRTLLLFVVDLELGAVAV